MNTVVPTSEIKTTKHTFVICITDGRVSTTPKLARCIEETVNHITKNDMIRQLPVDQFDDYFLVRLGSYTHKLDTEHAAGIVAHITHISLECEDSSKKKIIFGVWKRLKTSEVLR